MQQSIFQGWNTPSPVHTTRCDRCRLTDCYSVHDHAATSCPLQFCEVCTDLATLDQQVAAVQDQLIKLVRKRWVMKSRFNDHHDQLTRRLPMEIVSDIFLFVAASMQDETLNVYRVKSKNETRPSLFLGAICKRWRDITLGLPLLWSALYIEPWSRKFSLKSTEEWLRLSSAVPLSVVYGAYGDSRYAGNRRYTDTRVVNLLRSQATRWKHFTFRGPWKAFRDLFHNVNDIISLDTLDITIYSGYSRHPIEKESIHLHEPICLNQLTISYARIIKKIPIQWSNLTHFDISAMHLDEVLHVIRHGTKLTSCIVGGLLTAHGTDYPLPTTPIVHEAMTHFKLHSPSRMNWSNLIRYLILPHLKTFICQSNSSEQDALVDFLDRSGAPLHTFVFEAGLSHDIIPLLERLPAITHLELRCHGYNHWPDVRDEFFSALKGTTGTLLLPHLQELRMSEQSIRNSSWSIFSDIFMATGREDAIPGIVAGGAGDSEARANSCDQQLVDERRTRPLKSVYIRFQDEFDKPWQSWAIAEENVLSNLLAIRASGVRLEITDIKGSDIIEYAANIFKDRELPFSEDGIYRYWE